MELAEDLSMALLLTLDRLSSREPPAGSLPPAHALT